MSGRHSQAVALGDIQAPAIPLRGVLVVVAALLVLAGFGWLLQALADPHNLPLRKVRVQGAFAHLDRPMLERAVADMTRGGFFEVDVNGVRAAMERVPWVDQARVRRMWPDTLIIEVREQQVLARWNGDALVNRRGEVFRPEARSFPQGLPRLMGVEASSARVSRLYAELGERLAPLGLTIDELELDARRALRVVLANGIEVLFGRDRREARIARFTALYPEVFATRAADIARIDMRYTNGFAVRWQRPVDAHAG